MNWIHNNNFITKFYRLFMIFPNLASCKLAFIFFISALSHIMSDFVQIIQFVFMNREILYGLSEWCYLR